MDGLPVAKRSPALFGSIEFLAVRAVDDTCYDFPIVLESDAYSAVREPSGIVCGTVDRVDDPYIFM